MTWDKDEKLYSMTISRFGEIVYFKHECGCHFVKHFQHNCENLSSDP